MGCGQLPGTHLPSLGTSASGRYGGLVWSVTRDTPTQSGTSASGRYGGYFSCEDIHE